MNEPQPISPRRRLQELLAIPERQRSDEQWDEINELEITLASANRVDAPVPRRNDAAPVGKPKPRGDAQQVRKPFKKPHKRPPRKEGPPQT